MATTAPATSPLTDMLTAYFATKTSADVDGTMAYFSPDLATYVDATLGWDIPGYEPLRAVFARYMPGWKPPARSYAARILAGEGSALVHMVDTPELFGGELRILAAIDVGDDGIVRWIDYWDSSAFDPGLYAAMRTPSERFPADFREDDVPTRAATGLVDVASAMQAAFAAGEVSGLADMLHPDVTVADMALRVQVIGRIEGLAYLGRVLDTAPYGRESVLRHVVGGETGGGFEWTAADGLVGITALERDADGLVTSITTTYDSRRLPPARRAALAALTFAP